MTPEERFTKIENAIESLLTLQAEHAAKVNQQVDKQNAAIRDLAAVSRAVLDSVTTLRDSMAAGFSEVRASIEELSAEGKATDARLNVLIDITDRLLRRNGSDQHERPS